jgi:enoyl-CoA hydratase/carnithine racemase
MRSTTPGADPDVRAIMLTWAVTGFYAGLDLKAFAGGVNRL